MPEVHRNIVGRVKKRLSADKMKAGEETLCQISGKTDKDTLLIIGKGEKETLFWYPMREN